MTAPRKPPTHAKLIGSAVHAAVLEPDIFYSNYVVLPENFDGRTKENKEKVDSLKTSGRTPLKFEDYQHCLDMATALHTHATARRLLNQGCAEVSVFAEIDGIPVKCRPDWLRKESRLIVDLKTTEDASERGFTRSIAGLGYYLQAAWYLDVCQAAGIAIDTFLFIAVEKSPPYAVGIYELDDASLETGRREYQRALALWKHCTEMNEWPGYTPDIVTLQLPAWALREAA